LEEYPSLFCSKEIRRKDVPTTNRNNQIRTSLVKNVVRLYISDELTKTNKIVIFKES